MLRVLLALLWLAPAQALASADLLPAANDPVACTSPHDLWSFLDAEDKADRQAIARLVEKGCASLRRTQYLLVEDQNGVSLLRVFSKPGDWASSRLAYTLDELLPGR